MLYSHPFKTHPQVRFGRQKSLRESFLLMLQGEKIACHPELGSGSTLGFNNYQFNIY